MKNILVKGLLLVSVFTLTFATVQETTAVVLDAETTENVPPKTRDFIDYV